MSSFTPEELAERRNWLGGSDVPKLVGMSAHGTPMDVYLEKANLFGATEETDGTEASDIGTLQEPVIAELYIRRTTPLLKPGQTLALRGDGRTPVRRVIPVKLPDGTTFDLPVQATPDREVVLLDGEDEIADWGAEFKNRGVWTSFDWGPSGVGPIPDDVEMQVQWNMGVCEVDRWDVAAILKGNDFRTYTREFDPETFEMLLIAGALFWRDLKAGRHPDLGADEGTKRYLQTKLMKVKELDAVAPETDVAQWLAELIVARQDCDLAEKRKVALENLIKDFIGERGGITCPFGKATWFQNKDKVSVDYKLVLTKLGTVLDKTGKELLVEAIAQSTTTSPGARQFRVTPAGGDDE